MGWRGITVIPRRAGETRQATVDRVFAGGWALELDGGLPVLVDYPSQAVKPVGLVTRAERRWMLDAIDSISRIDPSLRPPTRTEKADAAGRTELALKTTHPVSPSTSTQTTSSCCAPGEGTPQRAPGHCGGA